MTSGESLAGIIVRLATMMHGLLGGWVEVTNVTNDGDSYLSFTLLPAGEDMAQWAANTTESYVTLVAGLTGIPLLAGEIASVIVTFLR